MIELKDLNPNEYPTTPDVDENLAHLLDRLNQFQGLCPHALIVTSGLRSMQKQIEIYQAMGKPPKLKSQHLLGRAADLKDWDKVIKNWCLTEEGLQALESIGFWCEDFDSTPTWIHVQTVPPKSLKRFFLP